MLRLTDIHKEYSAGESRVEALRGIDLEFRKSEFVAVLGPSGCGKTTLLNLIGGLDQYTSGDLVINGRSTRHFKDRDWDTYRNHSIGFVFQSYNLIPHQTVLRNVELALTLSGVSKKERRERAKKALEAVGLSTQLNKRPGEMSGGQMQRVAIARALVNEPDIILADEPTGALDSETSVQVMEILKQVAKDRLVIMVTHNPELADRYATRIIRMLDGRVTGDTAPLTAQEQQAEQQRQAGLAQTQKGKKKKPSMSFFTAFGLSLKNLFTKKGRTVLTAFAGSIGIIGIALIYAVSQGFTNYINIVQENTLSAYPLTIESTVVDLSSVMETFMNADTGEQAHENDAVYVQSTLYDMVEALSNMETTENDLKSFKAFIESEMTDEESPLYTALSGVQYSYGLDLLVYTENVDGEIIRSDSQRLMQQLMSEYMDVDMSAMAASSSMMMTPGVSVVLWQEMLPGEEGDPVSDVLEKQYDLVYGSWPNSYDEIVLVLDKNNELDDLTLYALGLETEESMAAIFEAVTQQKPLEKNGSSWSYEEICGQDYRVILNPDCYSYDSLTDTYTDLRDTEAGLQYLYDNALRLKVTGIIRPAEDADTTMLSGSIGYTSLLTQHVINAAKDSPAIEAQLADEKTDIFTALPFADNGLSTREKAEEFRGFAGGLEEPAQNALYVQLMSIPSPEELEQMTAQGLQGVTRADMEATMLQVLSQQMSMDAARLGDYLANMSDEEITQAYTQLLQEQAKMQYAQQVQAQLAQLTPEQLSAAFDEALAGYTDEQCARYYDEVMVFSDATYEENLSKLGYIDLESPRIINLYAATFEDKDTIKAAIDSYNETVDEVYQIAYTDYVGLLMSSITTIINTITYVLIAFVAISLIVSSIMIGVITLISVQERTKEIGILRAIGASKRDVSSMFNAETVIIGFTSGLFGVAVTYLLCIPINAIIQSLTGISYLSAVLPLPVAGVLVAISVLLTLISGIIPSRSAAKKDPVVALRTE